MNSSVLETLRAGELRGEAGSGILAAKRREHLVHMGYIHSYGEFTISSPTILSKTTLEFQKYRLEFQPLAMCFLGASGEGRPQAATATVAGWLRAAQA